MKVYSIFAGGNQVEMMVQIITIDLYKIVFHNRNDRVSWYMVLNTFSLEKCNHNNHNLESYIALFQRGFVAHTAIQKVLENT